MPTGKKVDPKVAEKLMLKAGLKPLEAYKNSDSPWRSECLKCHREVSPTYSNIRLGRGSCAYCSGRRVDLNEALHLLSSKNLEPIEPFATVMKPWKCKCLICGDLVSPNLNSLKRGQGGCIRCGYKNAKRYKVDTAKAIDLMLKAGVKPLEEYRSTRRPWKSKCLKCGNIVNPRLGSIMHGQGACGYCAGLIVDETKIIEQMIKVGLKPLEPYVAARKKWKCECLNCGQIVSPMYNSIQQGQLGCKSCGIKKASDKKTFTQEEANEFMLKAGFEPLDGKFDAKNVRKSAIRPCTM
jgi:hypothetical protein